MDVTSASAHDQRFVYTDSGEGPLVVLFHGFPDTPQGWADTRDALNDAGYRTVVPYLRGYHPDTIVPGRGYGAGSCFYGGSKGYAGSNIYRRRGRDV